MKVLLDTNIIIHREASKVINSDIGVLFYWIDKLGYTKYVHPLTETEIGRYADIDVVKSMNIKLDSYNVLKTEAPLSDVVKQISQEHDINANDIEDTKLLNEVFSNRVDLLISEDKKIHFKASLLDISDRVFRIDTFLEKVNAENPELVDYKVLQVKMDYFGNVNLKDNFFDTFREDYAQFDLWFNKKADERAYICFDKGVLSAFLFIKLENVDEDYSNISPNFEKKKRLKIGTFKVISNGIKLGERFLKIVFDNARRNKVDEIYVTIFEKRPEQLRLIALLEEWGFKYYGDKTSNSGNEKVYVRDFRKTSNISNPKLSYPWFSPTTNAFIVPIKPEYHTKLLPDSILNTERPEDFVDNEPYRNAISKSYISHAAERDLKPGDILVFYRSGDKHPKIHSGVATTIGIVESVIVPLNFDELKAACKKRTVLSDYELKIYWDRYPKWRPFVINFLYDFSFVKRQTLKNMLDSKIVPNMDAIKTINKMEREALTALIKLSGI